MKTKMIKKILILSGFVFTALFIFGINFNVAEASCPKGKVCFSSSGCANFNIGSRHYGGSEQCSVLGRNCPPSPQTTWTPPWTPSWTPPWTPPPPPPPPPPVHGVCGGANENFNVRTGLFSPAGTCAAGNIGGVSWNGTNYSWGCYGYNGGGNAYCSWNVRPVAGICGGLNGKIVTKQPASWDYMCSSGPQSNITISQNTYKWSCQGSYGGSDAFCQSEMLPQIGKCGDSFTSGSTALVEELPKENSILCRNGVATNFDSSSTDFSWICTGSGGAGNSEICKANKVGEGQTVTTFSTSTPVTNLDVSGRVTPNIANKGQYCTLSDLEYTTNPGADDSFVVCNVYRGNQVYSDQNLSTTGYQVEPGYDYIFRCNDLTLPPLGFGATGETNPLKCLLNPTILER
jgi:hypothetical protein